MAPSEEWSEVPAHAQLEPGTYRIRGTFRGAYNPVTTGAVRLGLSLKLAAQGNRLVRFDHAPPLFNAHDYTEGPWPFIARFERPAAQEPATAGLDGRTVLLAVGLLAAGALALVVVTSHLEQLVEVAHGIDPKTGKPFPPGTGLFSPGTIVLAVLAIFLITRARRAPA